MSNDPTRPVTRVRRPTMAQPAAPVSEDAAEAEAIQEEARAEEAAAKAAEDRHRQDITTSTPPTGAVRQEIRREGHAVPVAPGFEPRDGDVLVVTYPEVTLPLPKQYAMMKFGGLIYTRQLRAGDDVTATAEAIGGWLTRTAELSGIAKYRRLVADFLRTKLVGSE